MNDFSVNGIAAQLTIDLLSAWHLGTGRDGGAYADNLVNKDRLGLPMFNGKSLKGLLRAACEESYRYGWLPALGPGSIDRLFGTAGTDLASQGAIELGSAVLSEGEKAYFIEHPEAIKFLYRVDFSTAIEHNSGVAKDSSLRSMETVVPMRLIAPLKINAQNPADNDLFYRWINLSLPLVTAVGGKRRRGYGEALLSLSKENV